MDITQIMTPALLLDRTILERNLGAMARKAREHGVALRPHIKTHKSPDIASLQIEQGATGITVATLVEARIFAEAGFGDITHAFPLDPGKISPALELAEQITLRLTVDDLFVAKELERVASDRGQVVHAWLKVDCGYHRVGVDPTSDYAVQTAQFLQNAPHIEFDGLLTHAGQAYKARSKEELVGIANQERDTMIALRDRLSKEGIGPLLLSIGSTPTLSVVNNLEGIDEIRPGNYVFRDWTQVSLGCCTVDECALSVLATVVSRQPDSNQMVVDAGALALSNDPGPTHIEAEPGLGKVLSGDEPNSIRPELRISAISQEHGIIQGKTAGDLVGLDVGKRIRILPNHACLVAAMFDEYLVVLGDQLIDRWKIRRVRS